MGSMMSLSREGCDSLILLVRVTVSSELTKALGGDGFDSCRPVSLPLSRARNPQRGRFFYVLIDNWIRTA